MRGDTTGTGSRVSARGNIQDPPTNAQARICGVPHDIVQVCSSSSPHRHTLNMSRVYIGRLSYRAREKDVEKFFKGYGKILEVDLKNG